MMRRGVFAWMLLTGLLGGLSPARAGEDVPPPGPDAIAEEGADEDEGIGLSVELGASSLYVFRGSNVFQRERQMDPHALGNVGLSWAWEGLTVGYWSAYQLNGGNLRENIRNGTGVEQDFYVTWDQELPADLTLTAGLATYVYPAATRADAGARCPAYLEPSVALSWSGPVELALNLSYYAGLQDVLSDQRYVYVNPTVGRSFELGSRVGVELLLGFGAKLFTPWVQDADNQLDVLLSASLPVDVGGGVSLAPSLSWGWTNLQGLDVSEELLLWGGLLASLSL